MIQPVHPKENQPEYSLEGLMLNLKLQYFSHLIRRTDGEGGDTGQIVVWHHQLNGHEFERAPQGGEGQGGLVCCSPRGCEKSEMTE